MAKFLQAPIELYNGLIYGFPAVQEVNLLADTKGLPNASLLGNNSGVTGPGFAISLGTGLAFSGSTIICTVTGGSASLSFSNIAVAGRASVVADSTADTLTLAGLGGIEVLTDAVTDTLTFNIPNEALELIKFVHMLGAGILGSTGIDQPVALLNPGDIDTSLGEVRVLPNAITLAKMAQVATATFLGRVTAATGSVEALTVAQAKTLLDLTGTNSGDQTIPTSLPPSGTAGGDLVGAYPNPTLAASGVVAGTYGSATLIPVPAIDAKGRITSISTVAVSSGGSGTVSSVAATAPLAGFTITGSPVTTAGTFVFALSDDLAAVEGISTTGYAKRTAANTWTAAAIPFADIPAINTGTVADAAIGDIVPVYSLAASANRTISLDRIGGFVNPATCNGRLTLTTGVPVPSLDVTLGAVLYFTPFDGNRISLWDGTRWRLYVFSEINISFTSLPTVNSNYDVFVYDNSGTLTIVFSAAWTSDTVRANALGLQDGVSVLNSNKTRRHIGTVRSSATGYFSDAAEQRHVWNRYNRAVRSMRKSAGGGSHTYNGGYRAWGATTNQASYVTGEDQTFLVGLAGQQAGGTTGINPYAIVGVAYDSPSAASIVIYASNYTGLTVTNLFSSALGYHYFGICQSTASTGVSTFTNAELFAAFVG